MTIVGTSTCAMCKFSVKIEGDPNDYLECRRHAIQAVGVDVDGDVVSAFPACEPSMWCGEHERAVRNDAPSNYAFEW